MAFKISSPAFCPRRWQKCLEAAHRDWQESDGVQGVQKGSCGSPFSKKGVDGDDAMEVGGFGRVLCGWQSIVLLVLAMTLLCFGVSDCCFPFPVLRFRFPALLIVLFGMCSPLEI